MAPRFGFGRSANGSLAQVLVSKTQAVNSFFFEEGEQAFFVACAVGLNPTTSKMVGFYFHFRLADRLRVL